MQRELLLATLISAVWLTLSFLMFGILYGLAGAWFGPLRVMAWEASLGTVDLWYGVSIPRLSMWLYGMAVFVAVLPINYYWLRRLRRAP